MENATIYNGIFVRYRVINGTLYYANRVTVENLEHNKVYYYKRNINGSWDQEKATKFKTRDKDNFKFIFVGDPQIGGSHGRFSPLHKKKVVDYDEAIMNDTFNWNVTVTRAFEFSGGEPALLLSAGDQTDTANINGNDYEYILQENEYSGFLYPDLLKTIPSALSIGNHEAYTDTWRHHFNAPNAQEINYTEVIVPGPNYFFKYNNVLVIVLESNWSICREYQSLVNNAIEKYPNTEWRVAMFHHDLYSQGLYHSQEYDIITELRPCLTKLFDNKKIDLVINGHDHVYAASKFVAYNYDNVNFDDNYIVYDIDKNIEYTNPNGTLYLTANCSTGSKLYPLIEDELPYMHYANQSYSPTFGVLDFKKEKGMAELKITTYEVDTYNVIDGPYIFKKPLRCWSEPEFNCCSQDGTQVVYTDNEREWGIEDNSWCGILNTNTTDTSNAPLNPPPYPPSSFNTTVTSTIDTTITTTDILTTNILTTDIPNTNVTTTDIPNTNISITDIQTTNIATTDIPTANITTIELPISITTITISATPTKASTSKIKSTTTPISSTATIITKVTSTTVITNTSKTIKARPTVQMPIITIPKSLLPKIPLPSNPLINNPIPKKIPIPTIPNKPISNNSIPGYPMPTFPMLNYPIQNECADNYQQCGGYGYTGPTCCKNEGFKCVYYSDWYSMCDFQR